MLDLPTISLVITSALLDAINPCAIGTLILLISLVLGSGKSTRRLFALGTTFIVAVFVTYLAAGLGLIYFLSAIPLIIAEYLSIAVALLVILAGVLEIKDYFWYGKGVSLQIPRKSAEKIQQWAASKTSFIGVALLGIFVAGVELPCTGAPYLAVLTVLRINFDWHAFLLMFVYNLVFIAPLVFILAMVTAGVRISAVQRWKEQSKSTMRLGIGLLLVALGWILMLIANGVINFA